MGVIGAISAEIGRWPVLVSGRNQAETRQAFRGFSSRGITELSLSYKIPTFLFAFSDHVSSALSIHHRLSLLSIAQGPVQH
jgi:hypothetical protein